MAKKTETKKPVAKKTATKKKPTVKKESTKPAVKKESKIEIVKRLNYYHFSAGDKIRGVEKSEIKKKGSNEYLVETGVKTGHFRAYLLIDNRLSAPIKFKSLESLKVYFE